MKKSKILKNTFILIIGGIITKILGFITKILYTRYLKEEGLSLITLIFPTYTLLLTLSGFALPLAVSKLIAKNKRRKSSIIFNALYISILIDALLILTTILFSKNFSTYFLHDKRCIYLIIILSLNLPFVSITSILKAYYFGTEKVVPISFSNVFEEISKMLFVIFLLPKVITKGLLYGVVTYLFISILCEVISLVILMIFLPKNINIKNISYKYSKECLNNLLNICVPVASGRIIASIGYFLEPIILTNLLLFKGYSSSTIHLNYGYYQGYTIPILTIPSFFLTALSSTIIPVIIKLKANNNICKIKKLLIKTIMTIVLLSVFYFGFLIVFGKDLMMLLYKSNKGYKYLKILAPFFILFYIENPLFSFLQGLDQEKKLFKITTFTILLKNVFLIMFILCGFGFNSLLMSEILNIILVILLCTYHLRKFFYYSSQLDISYRYYKKRKI